MTGNRSWGGLLMSSTRTQRRRRQQLAALIWDGLRARGESASLAHVLWLFILGLAVVIAQAPQYGWMLAPALCLFLSLVTTALFDWIYLIVPDRQLIIMLACGGVFLARLDTPDIVTHVLAGFGGWAFLGLIAYAYESWRGRAGLGAGDAKLFGVAGLWVGPWGLPSCMIAAVISALISVAIERRASATYDGEHLLPFGPHLALGLWLTLVFGPLEWI